MTAVPRIAASGLLLGTLLLAAAPLLGQANRPSYWITAGAGWALAAEEGTISADQGSALVAAGTIQHGTLVASVRGARANPSSLWDAGLLVGVGSPTRYRMRGSVAAGLGRIAGAGDAAWTLPVELQLAWRLGPNLAVAAYGFGSFTGPREFVGATLALQFGRLD